MMKNTLKLCALALLLLFAAGCASQQPVAVACPELPPVSKRMMAPAKNAPLLSPSLPMQQKTPTP